MKKLTPWNPQPQESHPVKTRVHIRPKPTASSPRSSQLTPSDWCQLENLRPWQPVGISKI
ncbi:MAG: hypothetical protein ACO34E_10155 [Limisphaerales bacterium]|jgi:hypothetical protein